MKEPQKATNTKIIHVDMDAFFASVEQHENPKLKGKAIVVGGSPTGRGVVAAASYEARKYGVRSAMPAVVALRKCPHLVFVKPNFDRYKFYSEIIRTVFYEYTPIVEPLSLDEAYLDVTDSENLGGSATLIANEIRNEIFKRTGLTASAGVSYNKFLAKMASDINKPNGMAVILPEDALSLIATWPIERFHGIGKSTAKKMHRLGIFSGADLEQQSMVTLTRQFGKAGPYYYNLVRGVDHRKVQPLRIRKSIGKERTFSEDLFKLDALKEYLLEQCTSICKKADSLGIKAKTISLKARYANFDTITRSKTLTFFTADQNVIYEQVCDLIDKHLDIQRGVRLIGVNIHNFDRNEWEVKQMELFDDKPERL